MPALFQLHPRLFRGVTPDRHAGETSLAVVLAWLAHSGCRFFEVNELEAMEDISNTSLLADYFARRRGALLVDVPQLEDLDRVDLFDRAMRTSAARGRVDTVIQRALEDGVIERHEAEEINEYHRRHLAAREEEIRAIVALFSRKKSQKK